MNHERQIRDIQIKVGSEWVPVSVDSGVKLIGVLAGDVDGSWTGT